MKLMYPLQMEPRLLMHSMPSRLCWDRGGGELSAICGPQLMLAMCPSLQNSVVFRRCCAYEPSFVVARPGGLCWICFVSMQRVRTGSWVRGSSLVPLRLLCLPLPLISHLVVLARLRMLSPI